MKLFSPLPRALPPLACNALVKFRNTGFGSQHYWMYEQQ